MSKSLDGQTVRIKGTDVVTTVRYCTNVSGRPQAVVDLFFHPKGEVNPQIAPFINAENPYGDCYDLDQIELQRGDGTWYTPSFRVR